MDIKVGQLWKFKTISRYGDGILIERIIGIDDDGVRCVVVSYDGKKGWRVGERTSYELHEFMADIRESDGELFFDFKDYYN